MSYKVKLKYTKPSAEVSLPSASSELINLINSYFDAGKITQKPVETIDGLNYTYEIVYLNKAAADEFLSTSTHEEHNLARETYCANNNITFQIEIFDET